MPTKKAEAAVEEPVKEPASLGAIDAMADELMAGASEGVKPHLRAVKAAVGAAQDSLATEAKLARPEGE